MIDPENKPSTLNHNQRIALAVSQFLVGLFIIFTAGMILHYHLPIPGDNGVHWEGVLIGILVVLHIKRVTDLYQMSAKDEDGS